MSRTNFAPTARTIIVALVVLLVGLLGAGGRLYPDPWGVVAMLAAGVLLLLGMVLRNF